jgi:hypothetical protein
MEIKYLIYISINNLKSYTSDYFKLKTMSDRDEKTFADSKYNNFNY